MKVLTRLAVLCVVVCTAACTSTQPNLALGPIGPRRIPPEAESTPRGALVVYSAFEAVSASSDSDLRRHSDYDLRSADGAVIKRVSNQEQAFSEDPAMV